MSSARNAGFTLVEMIVVMVLIGIMAAIGVGRFFDRAVSDTTTYAAQVQALLRFGQKTAIAQGAPVYVCAASAGLGLYFDRNCSMAVTVPSGSNSVTAPASVAVSIGGAATFSFDALGKPFAAGDDPVNTNVSSYVAQTISIAGGGITQTVTTEAETGYVH